MRMGGELCTIFLGRMMMWWIFKKYSRSFLHENCLVYKKKSYREQYSHSHYDYVNKMMSVKWGRKRNNKAWKSYKRKRKMKLQWLDLWSWVEGNVMYIPIWVMHKIACNLHYYHHYSRWDERVGVWKEYLNF